MIYTHELIPKVIPVQSHKLEYITLGCLFFAAFLNATMDTLKDHYSTSFAKNWNPNFWDATNSWNTCTTILGYHIDAYHLLKSAMVITLCIPLSFYLHQSYPSLSTFVWFCICTLVWNITFNIAYKCL